ncbi:hypothetical protein EIN_047670 [Entamoeba invadens IP1]|uniref:DH domain-containing protein n=1 Tax=Entamoeba invadens IP1 TaxID=370355 RepID=A0A0A1UDD9_ENTIV|nr:hypothetical protein EIN_047670 [Entamoeba invadens IP1]ELP94464.1 hypothetical protein EIN_047670 [Entamoeba invadens IP1]|eukprot:XP_004261235.1 hypothetical protein EIN_047670 [Entamoeba invadens IP1]
MATTQAAVENWPTLREILEDRFFKRLLRCYLADERSSENLDFIEAVEMYESQYKYLTPKIRTEAINFIKEEYLDHNAEKQVNLSYQVQQPILKKLLETSSDPQMDVFNDAKKATEYLLFSEQYTYFINKLQENTISTTKKDVYTLYLNQCPMPKPLPLYPQVLQNIIDTERKTDTTVEEKVGGSTKALLDSLIQDEMSYIGTINSLCELKEKLLTKKMITKERAGLLLDHLPVLLLHHQKFAGALEEYKKDGKGDFGSVLNTGLHFLVLYRYYLRRVPKNISVMCKLVTSDEFGNGAENSALPLLDDFDKQQKMSKKMSLLYMLLQPFFRIRKYQEFVEEFIKAAKKESSDLKELETVRAQLNTYTRVIETYSKVQKIERLNDTLRLLFPFSFATKSKIFMNKNEIMGIAILDKFERTDITQMSMSLGINKKMTLMVMTQGVVVTDLLLIRKKSEHKVIDKSFSSVTLTNDIRDVGMDEPNKILWIDVPDIKKRLWFGCEKEEEFRLCYDAIRSLLSS